MSAKTELRNIQNFLLAFRKLDKDMTIQRLNILLEVYLNEEIDQTSLVQKANLTPSAASKNIAAWTQLDGYKRKAPGYIKSTPDPMNLKTRIITITDKGRRAIAEIIAETKT